MSKPPAKRARGEEGARAAGQAAIRLTEVEQNVFRILQAAKAHGKLQTTVRAVGGWVRDKLLGLESDDIDIAVDDMSGAAFAEEVRNYLKAQGEPVGRLAVIERNPAQSKHLETATMRVCGLSLDFVNLRAEAYSDPASRIPAAVRQVTGCPAAARSLAGGTRGGSEGLLWAIRAARPNRVHRRAALRARPRRTRSGET